MLQAKITAHGITFIAAFGVRGFARCMAHSVLSMWPNVQGLCTAFGHATGHGLTGWHQFSLQRLLLGVTPYMAHNELSTLVDHDCSLSHCRPLPL